MCGSRSGIIFFCCFSSLFSLCLAPDALSANLPSANQVLDDPNYSWKMSASGDVYRVYDPSGARASAGFAPSGSFSEGVSGGAIQTFSPQPLTIDGATGEVVTNLSRSLTVGDLVDGLGKLISADNPIGLTILGASTVLPIAQAIYDQYESTHATISSSSYSSTYYCGSTPEYAPSSSTDFVYVPDDYAGCSVNSPDSCGSSTGCFAYQQPNGFCPGQLTPDGNVPPCSNGSTPSAGPNGSSVPPGSFGLPKNLPQWVANNWTQDNLSNDASNVLQNNPSYGPILADQLAQNDAPLASPEPYTYSPTTNTLSEPSTTSTSIDPSTGDTTTTTSTPSFKVSPGPSGGLQVQKIMKQVTQTCTSAGACTVTNSSTQTQPTKTKSPFIPPSSNYPKVPTTVPTNSTPFTTFSFGSAWLPKSCPSAPTFQVCVVGGSDCQTEKLPTSVICKLASGIEPVVTAGGGLLGLLILAW